MPRGTPGQRPHDLTGQLIIHGVTRPVVAAGRIALQRPSTRGFAPTFLQSEGYRIRRAQQMLGVLKMYDNIEVHVDLIFGPGGWDLRQHGCGNSYGCDADPSQPGYYYCPGGGSSAHSERGVGQSERKSFGGKREGRPRGHSTIHSTCAGPLSDQRWPGSPGTDASGQDRPEERLPGFPRPPSSGPGYERLRSVTAAAATSTRSRCSGERRNRDAEAIA